MHETHSSCWDGLRRYLTMHAKLDNKQRACVHACMYAELLITGNRPGGSPVQMHAWKLAIKSGIYKSTWCLVVKPVSHNRGRARDVQLGCHASPAHIHQTYDVHLRCAMKQNLCRPVKMRNTTTGPQEHAHPAQWRLVKVWTAG